jgi:hypothetical protein
MAAPFNDILSKLEAALKSLVDALALTGTRGSTANVAVTVNTGLDDETIARPSVICQAEDTSEEAVRDSGVFRIKARARVYSHSNDEALTEHRARVGAVADAFTRDDIAGLLSDAAADFHVYDVQFMGLNADPEGDTFHTDIDFLITCCGSDL